MEEIYQLSLPDELWPAFSGCCFWGLASHWSPIAILHRGKPDAGISRGCCSATVEKLLLVSIRQPGEQYRGLWKGCIIPGAFLAVSTVPIRYWQTWKAAREFDEISPLLILSLMCFGSWFPEWVAPAFYMLTLQRFYRSLKKSVLTVWFWVKCTCRFMILCIVILEKSL